MNFKYAVFDLDGTLLDSQKQWDKAERDVLSKHFGIDMYNDEDGNYIPFTGLHDMFKKASARTGKTCDFMQIHTELYENMTEIYKNGDIKPKPMALEFLRHIRSLGVRTAIATATPIYMCRPAIERLGIIDYIEELVCTDDVGKSKESPDVYDRALSLIGGNKKEAMVFEDTLYCLKTLKNNGYKYIIIEDEASIADKELMMAGAERYIKSYGELM